MFMLRSIIFSTLLAVSGSVLASECPRGKCEAEEARCRERGGGIATCQREAEACEKRCEADAERAKQERERRDEERRKPL